MKNKVSELFFNYAIDFKGKSYKKGYAYKLNMNDVDIKTLLRMGCIYAAKDAKYYQEPKIEIKPVEKTVIQEVKENVDNKTIEPAKVQTRPAFNANNVK